MKRQLSFAVLAALVGAFALVVLAGVPSTYPAQAQAQASPSVAVSLSSASVEEGAAITVTMSFGGLESDADTATRDYLFRADVVGADGCEDQAGGYGLGVDRYMWQVDEDPEVRTGSVSADCPAGDYTVEAVLNAPDETRIASARASFTVTAPAPTPTPTPGPTPEPAPLVAIALFPSSVEPGTAIAVTIGFIGLQSNWDTDTTDYIFRADVVDADACEGDGLGVDRYMYQVDEDPETRTGTISADCPAGDYTLKASISSSDGVELASARASFSVAEPEEEGDDPPDSAQQQATRTDITLHEDNADPISMTSDGTTLWVTDRVDDKLYAYALADGTRQDGTGGTADKEFDLHTDNGEPRGIWTDGTNLWAANWNDGNIYVYALADGTRQDGTGSTINREFNLHPRLNKYPDSIWSDGTTMWVGDIVNLSILAYALADGTNQNGSEDNGSTNKQFLPHSSNGEVGGIWADGTTMWVADLTDDKLYAYLYTDVPGRFGQHFAPRQDGTGGTTNKEFQLRAGNGYPLSIWSDGTTMWVLDPVERKIFVYPLLDEQPLSPPGPKLTELSVNPGTLLPSFDSDTLDYTVIDVPRRESNWITVIATAESGASVSYEDGYNVPITDINPTMLGDQLPLPSRSRDFNYIRITVSKDGLSRVYDLTVTYVPRPPDWRRYGFHLHTDNRAPRGVYSNGATMWVTDYSHDKLFAYRQFDGSRESDKDIALDASNDQPWGIWSNGETMWVSDWDDDKIYAYNLSSGARDSGKDIDLESINLPPDEPRDSNTARPRPRGIWSNDTTMWVAYSEDDKLYAYNLADGGRDSAWDITLDPDNDNRQGIWSDGTFIWVADDDDLKLYAYWLGRTGGKRYPARDLDLSRTDGRDLDQYNSDPRGIWSDGRVIWVADRVDYRIYSYQLPPTPPPPPPVATLRRLEVVDVNMLKPTFDPETTFYHATVANSVDKAQLIATPTHDKADIVVSYINKEGVKVSGRHPGSPMDLYVVGGDNVITVEVTSSDGLQTKTYKVAVWRMSPEQPAYQIRWPHAGRSCEPDAWRIWTVGSWLREGVDISTLDLSTMRPYDEEQCSANVLPPRVIHNVMELGGLEVKGLRLDSDGNLEEPYLLDYALTVTWRAQATDYIYYAEVRAHLIERPPSCVLSYEDVGTAPTVGVRWLIDNNWVYSEGRGGLEWHEKPVAIQIPEGATHYSEKQLDQMIAVRDRQWETKLVDCRPYGGTVSRAVRGAPAALAAPAAPPDAPDQPTGEVLEPGRVTLDWEDVDGATGYQVGLYSQSNLLLLPSADLPGVTVQISGSSATLTGLPAGWSHYWLKVRAINDYGTSGWSDWLTLANG